MWQSALEAPESFVLNRLPQTARKLALLGAPAEALRRRYLRRNPAAEVVALAAADAELPGPADGGFDAIAYLDILDRVADPAALLRRHAGWLAEAGTVLISLDNAEYCGRAEHLLRGSAGHVGGGGLTANAVERALGLAGFTLNDRLAFDLDPDGAEALADALAPGLARLGIDPQAFARRSAARRLLWRARRQPRRKLTLAATMLHPIGGVSHVRVVEPMQALAGEPDVAPIMLGSMDYPPRGIVGPKIFIMHRPAMVGEAAAASLRQIMADGWLTVCEFDDNPSHFDLLQQQRALNFSGMHAVQTTTEPLAELLRAENPEIGIFPNAVPELPEPRNYADPERLTLLCAGINREDESPPYVEVFNRVAAQAGARLRFRIVGDLPLFDALRTPHKTYTPICDYDVYRALLAESEVSFMPLRDTPFNRCKSDLKFLEAAAHRVTALASPLVYQDSIDDRRTGLIFANAAELEHNLTRLLANPGFGRTLADNARRYVIQHRMLADQVAARMAWYRSLWARKEALQQAVLARVPELAGPPGAAQA